MDDLQLRRRKGSGELDTAFLLERIALALEAMAPPRENSRPPTGPVHSGHKGGDFLKAMKGDFDRLFPESQLDWQDFSKWITTLFKLASRLTSKADVSSPDDVKWMYNALSTSLKNGFAHELSKVET